jgi:hypothetical protein
MQPSGGNVSITDQIRDILKAHPLEVGEGVYVGHIVCSGCGVVTSNPVEHLTRFLAEVLDPSYPPFMATNEADRGGLDPRESQIDWGEAS